jgi:hypothetical protein
MGTRSTSKKSLKSFNVRNGLWKLFEVRAAEMECSIDYLVNEAMRLYARTHNFASSVKVESARQQFLGKTSQAPAGSSMPPAPASGGPVSSVPVPTRRPESAMPRSAGGMAPVRPSMAPVPPSIPRPSPAIGPSLSQPPSQPAIGSVAQRHSLTLIFQGRKLPITSAQFIIGRGSKSSDLAIKDANISRKHAAVIFHNGAYYLKDLGSTNGIEFNGRQVDSKRIDEGDVFSICGYDLHFTYSS